MLAEMPLYTVIYYSLLFQIVFGEYAPGDRLPSRSELARQFRTSERTVRSALSLLAQNGYISMCSGRSAVVVFDADSETEKSALLHKFETRRGTLRDIRDSYRFLLPSFVYLGLFRMSREDLSELFRDVCAVLEQDTVTFDRQSYRLIAGILMKTGSQNIFLYFVTTQLYLRLSVCAHVGSEAQAESLVGYRRRVFRCFARDLRAFLLGEGKIRRGTFMAVADWYEDHMLRGLGLDDAQAAAQAPMKIFFDYEPKYLNMSFDLIEKICDGKYRIGEFLPSDTAVAAEYRVAVLTARKAYKMLNELGFAKTVPQVGTQVMVNASGPMPLSRALFERHDGIQGFLDCMRFLRAGIHGMALFACNHAEALEADLARLEEKISGPARIYQVFNFISLLDCVARHTGNFAFYTYFSTIKPFLFFGAYFLKEQVDFPALLEMALGTAGHLRNGDRKAFAAGWERTVLLLADCAEKAYADAAQSLPPETAFPLAWAVTGGCAAGEAY